MTTPSNDDRQRLSQQLQMRGQSLGRRQARRLSRRFAVVGVHIPPLRLQQMFTGSPVADREVTDVHFALIASRLNREKQAVKFAHLQSRCRLALIYLGLGVVALNFLFCVAYLFFTLTQQTAL